MKLLYTLVIFLSAMISSCQSQPAASEVDAKTFHSQIQAAKDPVILDVRTPEEFADGRIPNAINMDIYEPDFKQKVTALDKNKTYFVYCHAGGRGNDALDIMKKEGFTNVVNLDGGIVAWRKSKFPVVVE